MQLFFCFLNDLVILVHSDWTVEEGKVSSSGVDEYLKIFAVVLVDLVKKSIFCKLPL